MQTKLISSLIVALVAAAAASALSFTTTAASAETRIFGFSLKTVVGSGKPATEQRTITAFDRIEISDGIQATLRRASSPSVTVTADDNIAPLVDTRTNGSTLIIGMRKGSNVRTKSAISVAVGYTNLDRIVVQDGVRADVDALTASAMYVKVSDGAALDVKSITAQDVEVNVSDGASARIGEISKVERHRYRVADGARLTLEGAVGGRAIIVVKDGARLAARGMNVSNVDVSISDGASAQLVGSSTDQTFKLSDGASVDARDLRGMTVVARVTDASSLELGVVQKIDLQVSDGGSVRYTGEPQMMVKKGDGGSVRKY